MIFKHKGMIVQPDIFVEFRRIESLNFVKRNDSFALVFTKYDISFHLFFIKQDISVSAGAHTSPFIALEVASIAFGLQTGMRKNHNSGIVEFNPA